MVYRPRKPAPDAYPIGAVIGSLLRRCRPGSGEAFDQVWAVWEQAVGSAIAAVNEGAVFRYIVKPWDADDLRMILRAAMEHFLVQRERDLLLSEKATAMTRTVPVKAGTSNSPSAVPSSPTVTIPE